MNRRYSKKRLDPISGASTRNHRLNPGRTYSLKEDEEYVESALSESSRDLLGCYNFIIRLIYLIFIMYVWIMSK